MIYNKNLDLSDCDIANEDDINTLNKWKIEIERELADFNTNTADYEKLSYRQIRVKSGLIELRKLCRSKIATYVIKLKEEGKWKSRRDVSTARHLASVFMKIAKDRLTNDLYKEILADAQMKIKQDTDMSNI